jgi:hypothetical protein
MLNPGNEDTILHKQLTGGCVRLELNIFTSSSCSNFLFLSNVYIKGEHLSYSTSVWGKDECKGFIVDWALSI